MPASFAVDLIQREPSVAHLGERLNHLREMLLRAG
jgi:hypothetical protein